MEMPLVLETSMPLIPNAVPHQTAARLAKGSARGFTEDQEHSREKRVWRGPSCSLFISSLSSSKRNVLRMSNCWCPVSNFLF